MRKGLIGEKLGHSFSKIIHEQIKSDPYELIPLTEEEFTWDEENFIKIYNLFIKNKFNFIEDIILKYLEIFTLDYDKVNKKINDLKDSLGENYQTIISNDMKYLSQILE